MVEQQGTRMLRVSVITWPASYDLGDVKMKIIADPNEAQTIFDRMPYPEKVMTTVDIELTEAQVQGLMGDWGFHLQLGNDEL